jgi:tryptophanyl-tRNA synthetase
MQNRLALQDAHDQVFYMIADLQALTDNADNPEKVHSNVLGVAMDNLAVGIDPNKTTFFVQSQVPEIAELTMLFMNLVTLARLKRNPTVKNEMAQKGFGDDVPVGFLAYPISQAADILSFGANLIPVGDDQLPVIEQANEIGAKFNALYGETFPKIDVMLSSVSRLIGIDGNAKASKSLNNAIYLSDPKEEVERKVMSMYTDPDHIRLESPGKVEGNVVFAYLDAFDPDMEGVQKLKEQYRAGGLGDVVIKRRLIDVLETLITPIRERRAAFEQSPEMVRAILRDGTARARGAAAATLKRVRTAIGINYFE